VFGAGLDKVIDFSTAILNVQLPTEVDNKTFGSPWESQLSGM